MRFSSVRAVRLRHDLGGEWFLHPVVLIAIVPPATLASVVDLSEPTVHSVIGWTVANLVSFLPCVAITFGLVRATRRRRQHVPLPISVTVLVGALFGVVKVLGTAGAGAALGLTSLDDGSLGGRVLLGTVFGMLAVPAVVLMRATLARYRIEHRFLVAETFAGLPTLGLPVDGTPITEEGAAARQQAAVVLQDLRASLAQAQPALASGLLTEAVEKRLRPLTHRLWSGARLPSSDLTVGGLLRAMLRRPTYPLLWPTLMHGLVIMLFALNRVGTPRAVATGAVAAAALAAVLVLGRMSHPRVESPLAGVAHVTLVLIAAAWATTLIRIMLAPEFMLPTAALVALMVAWVLPLMFTASVVSTVLHDRDAVRAQLIAMLGPDWYAQLMRTHGDAAAARDIADRLHGDLQGELLASAARIDRLGHDDAAIQAELAQVERRLDSALSAREDSVRLPFTDQLTDLQTRWDGLLAIQIALDIDGPIGVTVEDLIVGIVSEALTNARRHGMARQVSVRIGPLHQDGSGVLIQIDDDGIGPRKGVAGIGSAHLDAVAPGAWSRARREQGGTRLEVVLARGTTVVRAGVHGSDTSQQGSG